ncbi:hypothetical protein [Aliiruegeria lutimaris]|uniref:Uncharacterized protein n=1 Tax=Aliiruegeria lutimaris TaxID=571298 RepID=A0A1G8ZP52_9RHOB|nr:hypothetical protein [Aliiruegeria lutimaris]SDK16902.1 hypothetical protein SAMN04488026_10336 [Aliiruegeria lutimaris]
MSEEFPELPDDNELAFLQLEAEFRRDFTENINSNQSAWKFDATDYMNKTLAAARALEIDSLFRWQGTHLGGSDFDEVFWEFYREVDSVLIHIRVQGSRRSNHNSVGLTDAQKTKIHALIEKIRTAVEESYAETGKKERLFEILATLAKEVSKPRTALARFGDLARGLAGISRNLAGEGAEPWWKWAKIIFGEVDDAKEREPHLPKPAEAKRIEPPRKELPKPKAQDLGDEIPF